MLSKNIIIFNCLWEFRTAPAAFACKNPHAASRGGIRRDGRVA
jgi:hypothetical protein